MAAAFVGTRAERIKRFGVECADTLEWKGWYDIAMISNRQPQYVRRLRSHLVPVHICSQERWW